MPRPIDALKELADNELDNKQRDLSEQIFRLRFQMTTGQSEGLKKLREARKDLARVKTLLRQREPRKA
ncbi:MAG: 50S ribosomal protein L29 [Candidatus Acidiferrales bacterium]|jgi:large subunit ribosomal protein L29